MDIFFTLLSFHGLMLDLKFDQLEGKINMVLMVFLYHRVPGTKFKIPCLRDMSQNLVIRTYHSSMSSLKKNS